jgi:tyrosine-protein kinase Etk/Wzc
MSTEFSTELFGGGGAGTQGRETAPINIKRLLYTQGKLMAIIAVVVVVASVPPVWLLVAPQYEATAAIQFSEERPAASNVITPVRTFRDYERHIETQGYLIRGAEVQKRVANNPSIQQLPLIQRQDDPVTFLMREVMVRREPSSALVRISFRSPDSEAALQIVTVTREEYIRLAASMEEELGGDLLKQVIEQKNAVDRKLDNLRESIDARRDSIQSLPLGIDGNSANASASSYHGQLSLAVSDLRDTEIKVRELHADIERMEALIEENRANPNDKIFEYDIEAGVAKDVVVVGLQKELAVQEAKVGVLADKYQSGRPELAAYVAERDGVAKKLRTEEARARRESLEAQYERTKIILADAENAVESAQSRVDDFTKRLDAYSKEQSEVFRVFESVGQMKEDEKRLREESAELQRQITALHAQSGVPASVSPAGPASVPGKPDNKKRIQVLALCVVAACGLAFVVGFLREWLDKTVRSLDDLRYLTDAPVITAIPHLSVDKLPDSARAETVMGEYPGSTLSNEYRRVLTRIIYPPEGSAELNTVLVSSAMRGDGKTSSACNLAIALGQANRRVLLIDLAARRPTIEKVFGLPNEAGLSEMFSHEVEALDAVRETHYANLNVLGTGRRPKEIIGKLASREMVELLEGAEEAFDHVIIDTPPVLLMSDAKLLAPVVDGVLVVVGAHHTSKGMIRRCVAELRQAHANIIGLVLNGLRPTRGGYIEENVAQYYRYTHDMTPEAPAPAADHDKAEPATILLMDEPESEAEPATVAVVEEPAEAEGDVPVDEPAMSGEDKSVDPPSELNTKKPSPWDS